MLKNSLVVIAIVIFNARSTQKIVLEALCEKGDNSCLQLKTKQAYQQREMQDKKRSVSSPSLRNNQVQQVKSVLKQE